MSTIKNIIEDTLKKRGKYDKQALTFFASFVISVCLGVSNTVMSYILNVTENQTADSVFNAFMMLTGALSGVNVANKLVDSKVKQTEEEING
jgi:hypothetical protein